MSKLADFESLAARTAIPLPDVFRNLLACGATEYGADWSSTWRERCLHNPPALISCVDFEWIDAAQSQEEIEAWLHPEAQGGRSFLPFAKSGAGDLYCLVPFAGPDGVQRTGVAYVWHDSDAHRITYGAFTDFVCGSFLQAFADVETSLAPHEALQSIQADVQQVARCMGAEQRDYLRGFCQLPWAEREFRDGPRSKPRKAWSLISQEQLDTELEKFPSPGIPLPIVSRDDLIPEPQPGLDWRSYAADPSNPKSVLAAAEGYRKEQGVSWAEARAAVERYIADPGSHDWQACANDPQRKFAAIQLYQKAHGVSAIEAKKAVDHYLAHR